MLEKLIELSNKYGSNTDYVLAGGGNTSYKADGVLYVKASGFKLADIDSSGFVAMDMEKLRAVTKKPYPGDEKRAEALVLSDMMDSRLPGQTGRPSVEALLHALFPQSFVVHLHPAALNGLTCSKNGRAELESLFGQSAAWLDEIKPGYTLAMASLHTMVDYRTKTGRDLTVLVMQNHGIFFAADDAPEIEELISDVFGKIEGAVKKRPDMTQTQTDTALAASLAPALRELVCPGGSVCFFSPAALPEFVGGTDGTLCAFTPDHIVYCGHAFCRVGACADLERLYGGLEAAIKDYKENEGVAPKIVCVDGLGAFACGASVRDAATAKALFCDAIKIYCFAQSFGGHRLMERGMIDFIRSWEVESYRKKVASQGATVKRLSGKTAVITGGAQGFGAGLARFVCSEGANTVIADINEKGAAEFAAELNAVYGEGAAAAVGCDVSDEASVRALCERACLIYGGIDVFISNAGILRSGGLEDMDFKTFELMTRVNYSAFFLCSKYASRAMKTAHRFSPGKFFDIIQINSKSGLAGSNKNFAYAGGKFGGIGLVQSFALELVPYNIKVNAICPGNFLDGPLWTDPEKGLFVQYLRAGKVPGAKTTEDVRRAYEAKVPMNRGCEVKDVARALIYAIEQEYETGQAIPVTGGQNMLK